MKKIWVLLTALLMLVLLPNLAAAEQTIEIHEFLVCESGQMRLPVYPDWSAKIGEGLTKEDFIITYQSSSPYVTVEPDGTLQISSKVPMLTNMPLEVIYTPKVEGVGEKTIFQCRLRTVEPVTKMEPEKAFYRVRQGEEFTTKVDLGGAYYTLIASVVSDSPALKAEIRETGDRNLQLRLTAVQGGTANVVITALNGMQTTITVDVVGEPSQFKFAAERFTCSPGETIDLGLDTGNGPYGLEYFYSFSVSATRDGQYVGNGCLDTLTGNFRSGEAGEYHIVCRWKEVTGEVWVSVLDPANCAKIELSTGELYQGREAAILLYDEYGETIYRPMEITCGAELVERSGRSITAKAPGTVEITVRNDDGTTTSRTFEVVVNPTEMYLSAYEINLAVGETYDMQVSFDQGSYPYYYYVYSSAADEYGQPYVSVVGDTFIARSPGQTTVSVHAGPFTQLVEVTVTDSDERLSILHPEGDFGVGHTFQLKVVDKTGRIYPATFYVDSAYAAVSVTEDGLMTGVNPTTTRVYARLENGCVLYYLQEVVQIPTWIAHEDLVFKENSTLAGLRTITSDVGPLDRHDVTVTIADESVATMGVSTFSFHKAGTTEVTLTAVRGGAECTFLLTVEPADDTLYIFADGKRYENHYYGIHIPSGYGKSLPKVCDYYGNEVRVTWKITDESIAMGNTGSSAFRISGNTIRCTFPDGWCQLTATASDGRTICMSVWAFRLATAIEFRQASYTVQLGEHVQTEVSPVDLLSGDRVGELTWTVGDPAIIAFDEDFPATGMPTVTGLKPGTTTLTATQVSGNSVTCTITVLGPSRTPGDVLDNGGVTLDDALALLQHCAGEAVAINERNADVNADGNADVTDALIILQYIAGWNVTLQ